METGTPGSGGGQVPAGQPPVGQAPVQQPPAQNGFNWGPFPDVPEDARSALEPHLRGVQAYVTQLEQAHAPFKSFADAGLTPEQTQGLLTFAQMFENNPVSAWMTMGRQLSESGQINEMLDLDLVQAYAQGMDPDDDGGGQQVPGAEQNGGGDPALLQRISQLEQQLTSLNDGFTQDRTAREQADADALFNQNLERAKEAVKAATGREVNDNTELALVGMIAASGGDIDAAIQSYTTEFGSGAQQAVQTAASATQTQPPNMPNGAPPSTPKSSKSKSKDPFDRAEDKARQFVEQQNRSAAADAQ